ncbi:MAG: hypothetical protein RML46_06600 [Anaerolineae bacterium]|nr:hypothetical protein [Anaerolineae bacterium]
MEFIDPVSKKAIRESIYQVARERIYAVAGDGRGNLQFQRGKIWVQIPGKGITWAWSFRFTPRYGQPVWLERRVEDGSLEVVDQVIGETGAPSPMLVAHRHTHMEGGIDPIVVTPGMVDMLRVVPADPPGRAVRVRPGVAMVNHVPTSIGQSYVSLSRWEVGQVVWIVVREGVVQAAEGLQPGDTPLARVTVQETVTASDIQDMRVFVDGIGAAGGATGFHQDTTSSRTVYLPINYFLVGKTATQVVPHNTNAIVTFNEMLQSWNTSGGISWNSTLNGFQISQAGVYWIYASIQWASSISGAQQLAAAVSDLNGNLLRYILVSTTPASSTVALVATGTAWLNANEVVRVEVNQQSGAQQTISARPSPHVHTGVFAICGPL